MIKIKLVFISAMVTFCCASNLQAQATPIRGVIVKGGRNPGGNISFGIGSDVPNSSTKDDAYLTNSQHIQSNAYVPLLFKQPFSVGFNLGADYNFSNAEPNAILPTGYKISGQTASNIAYKSAGSPKNSGFKMGGGVQINFRPSNHFYISAIFTAGYLSNTHNELSIVQTSEISGKAANFILTTIPIHKTTGLFLMPQLRLNYMLSNTIGLYAEGNFLKGPNIITKPMALRPLGEADANGNYTLNQLQSATNTAREVVTTPFNTMGLGAGLIISLSSGE
jgi:hypothetical protein